MNPEEEPAVIPAEKMDLGVEDMLFIDIYQEKRNYHLQDCCVGRVDFKLLQMNIKQVLIGIVKREITGSGMSAKSYCTRIGRVEVMDGTPREGNKIPIRLYLEPFDLTPTYKPFPGIFQVKYYLEFLIID